jgi:fatty acid desaturase
VFLLGFVALRWRVSHTLGQGRPIASVVFAALTAAAASVPAIVAVALVATVWLGLHTFELVRWRDERARQRAATLDAVVAPE